MKSRIKSFRGIDSIFETDNIPTCPNCGAEVFDEKSDVCPSCGDKFITSKDAAKKKEEPQELNIDVPVFNNQVPEIIPALESVDDACAYIEKYLNASKDDLSASYLRYTKSVENIAETILNLLIEEHPEELDKFESTGKINSLYIDNYIDDLGFITDVKVKDPGPEKYDLDMEKKYRMGESVVDDRDWTKLPNDSLRAFIRHVAYPFDSIKSKYDELVKKAKLLKDYEFTEAEYERVFLGDKSKDIRKNADLYKVNIPTFAEFMDDLNKIKEAVEDDIVADIVADDIDDKQVADDIANRKKGRVVKDEKTNKFTVLADESTSRKTIKFTSLVPIIIYGRSEDGVEVEPVTKVKKEIKWQLHLDFNSYSLYGFDVDLDEQNIEIDGLSIPLRYNNYEFDIVYMKGQAFAIDDVEIEMEAEKVKKVTVNMFYWAD